MTTSRSSSLFFACACAVILMGASAVPAYGATTLTIQSPDNGDTVMADDRSHDLAWKTSAKVAATFFYFLIPGEDTPVLPPPPLGGSSVSYLTGFGGYNIGGKAETTPTTSHTGTFVLDADVPTGSYTIAVYATNAGTLTDPDDALFMGESDPFTIQSTRSNAASIDLVSPNGGETWVSGSPQILRFRAKGIGTMQLALQNLKTGQPCTIATNISTRSTVWMIIPVVGTSCIGSATQRLTAGEYRAALYDTNWSQTRASAYGEEPFTLAATPKASQSETERLTDLISILKEILLALRAAQQ